jgi:hypothetical protein
VCARGVCGVQDNNKWEGVVCIQHGSWRTSLGILTMMVPVYVQQFAKTDLDTAVYFVQAILLIFEYFYLYVPEKQL